MNESSRWAVSLALQDARHASALRLCPGVEVCVTDAGVWLRGDGSDEALHHRLRLLPGARRFVVLPDLQLQAVGTLAPKGYLPAGPWQPLRDWSQPQPPAIGQPGATPSTVQLRLVRCHEPAEPTLLLASWKDWSQYATTAPQVRLQCLAFALADDHRLLLRGSPLPPLKGERWVERAGIAVPAGWTWSPAVDALVVRQLLELEAHDLAVLHAGGVWERVAAGDFVRATRSAARNTAEQIAHAT